MAITAEQEFGEQEFAAPFEIEAFLSGEREKDLLRFSTAGSVDDGKSTLIGRLLYDTQSVYDDHVRSIEGKGSAGDGQMDFALLTDGLRAEREQGITIDVAYRYFATSRRKFIIADTPGHEQYTRNMATGASTADVAIVLVDARKGVLVQSRRHAYITSLLGVRHVIIAVNKMDLVGYAEGVFEEIRSQFGRFYEQLDAEERYAQQDRQLYFVPVSALTGENVARRSEQMEWYGGPTLLDLLESIPTMASSRLAPFRMAVQRVIRPHQNYRGFAGQIASGTVRPGDSMIALPSGRTSRVRSIETFDGELEQAFAPMSVSLTLEDEIDVSRGDMLAAVDSPAQRASKFTASIVWMNERPLVVGGRYLLKQTSRTVSARIHRLVHRVEIATLAQEPAKSLAMNETGLVEVECVRALALDVYGNNRVTGSFVLIDVETNATVAAGMIREVLQEASEGQSGGEVLADERFRRWGHRGGHVAVEGDRRVADAVERALFERGAFVLRLENVVFDVVNELVAAGAIVVTNVHVDGRSEHVSVNGDPVEGVAGVLEAVWGDRENELTGGAR